MKKILALILALSMSLCLVACGGGEEEVTNPKLEEAQTAVDAASAALDEVKAVVEANAEAVGADMVDLVGQMEAVLGDTQTALDDIAAGELEATDEQFDDLIAAVGDVETWCSDAMAQMEALLGGGEATEGQGDVVMEVTYVGTWHFCGGLMNGAELDQAGFDETLAQYGGTLDCVIAEDGSAQLVQGGGTLYGTVAPIDAVTFVMTFDNGGTPLEYACDVVESEGDIVLCITPDGSNYLYFMQ